ncbi:hypothetical protein QYF36_013835 [Acer negundo]|nr:hypothetical protein QYF36_013835 [Acer negundo]
MKASKKAFRKLILKNSMDNRLPATFPRYPEAKVMKGRRISDNMSSHFSTNCEPRGGPAGMIKSIIKGAPGKNVEPKTSLETPVIKGASSIALT